jgi:isopenicillin N synthase-like dioxygenase
MPSEVLDQPSPGRVEIPVVDFANWKPESTSEERKKVAEEIVDACKSVGFLCIVNHGISPERLSEAFSWSKKFFDLSDEQKLRAPHPDGSAVHRGYSWPGLEKVSDVLSAKDDPELAKKLREVTDYKVNHASSSLGPSIRSIYPSFVSCLAHQHICCDAGELRHGKRAEFRATKCLDSRCCAPRIP